MLDYFSKEEIEKNRFKEIYEDDTYIYTTFNRLEFFKTYGGLQFSYKKYDKKYIIQSISGLIYYKDNIGDCYKKQKEISQEFSEIFKNTKMRNDTFVYPKNFGSSQSKQIIYDFKSGDGIVLECIDFEGVDLIDNLRISIDDKEFQTWLKNTALN